MGEWRDIIVEINDLVTQSIEIIGDYESTSSLAEYDRALDLLEKAEQTAICGKLMGYSMPQVEGFIQTAREQLHLAKMEKLMGN